jgi:hypothetical protein
MEQLGWAGFNAHLVVEDLGLARLGLGDEGLVEDIEDILAGLLELGLDLLAVVADGANVLLGALGLLLLLDRGDDAPRGTSCSDDVLVGDGKEVALVNGELTADLQSVRSGPGVRRNSNSGAVAAWSGCSMRTAWAYLSDFLRNSQYVSCGHGRGCGWRLTFMYVTISVNSTVSTRGLTWVWVWVGHASTHHRSAQPVRTAWRGKSCCCVVNKPVVRGRQAVDRTSRAVGAVMLASVDSRRRRALGLSARGRGASRRPVTAGRSEQRR